MLLLGCERPTWEVTLGGEASAPVLTREGSILLVTSAPSLESFDAEGRRQWQVPLEGVASSTERPAADGPFGPIVLPTGGIAVAAGPAVVARFSEKGEQQWRVELPCTVSSSLAALPDGAVVVPCSQATLLVLEPDGRTRWSHQEPLASSASSWAPAPVITPEGAIIAGLGFTQLIRMEPDGTKSWTHRVSGTVDALALGPDGGVIYATSGTGTSGGQLRGLVVLSAAGTVRWFSELPEGSTHEPTTAEDGSIHVASNTAHGGAKLLRYVPGADREALELPAEPLSGVLLAKDGTRIVRIRGSRLLVLGEKTEVLELPSWRTTPLLGEDGALYATSRDRLHRLNLDVPGLAASAWSRPRGDNQASGTGHVRGQSQPPPPPLPHER